MNARAKRRVRLFALALSLLLALWLGSSSIVAWRLTHRRHPPYPERVPDDLLASTQALRLTTSDNQDIGAWFVPGHPGEPIVLLLHGLGGDRTALLTRLRILAHAGYGVLALTMRGHGDSSGDKIDVGWSSRFDVVAAVDWIGANHRDARIVVDGASMGAAAALFAAPELRQRVSGYVLECPYSDLSTAIRNRLDLALPPVLDTIAYAGLRTVAPIFLPELDRIAPIDFAASIPPTTPVLILSSLIDRHARPDEARALFELVASHAHLVWFEDAAHDRLVETRPEQWKAAVTALIDEARSAPRASR